MNRLRIQHRGQGTPTHLLLHGLGATGDVWSAFLPVCERQWAGSVIIPDLPGHRGSPSLSRYTFGGLAARIAEDISAGMPVVILGHSLGGVVALALASGWFGVEVRAVCALGVKYAWTVDELQRAASMSKKPNPSFPTRDEAADRHLKLAGLSGWIPPDVVSEFAVARGSAGWSAAFDPLAFGVGEPDMRGLLASAKCRVLLAAGETDAMCPTDGLQALHPVSQILPGVGHNAHVEKPEALIDILQWLRLPA